MKPQTSILGTIRGLAIVGIIWCSVMFGVIWFIITVLRFFNVIP